MPSKARTKTTDTYVRVQHEINVIFFSPHKNIKRNAISIHHHSSCDLSYYSLMNVRHDVWCLVSLKL
ncbi:CLUMA_CG000313, isoform A [Clunio marinus]|uniref:CLUMA_CG000313, isoform A n=1 Tax=Clunio marinus TaxID=568069 RepID=A0A1J1HEA2_9DIPT|nr:CLUMA_CG000313, isoform A [Clunio marinus]